MGLNKSNGNMYDWVTHTWNPLAGECPHKCSYCSTNFLSRRYPVIKNKYSGPIRLDENQMKTNLGKNNFIFICAQNDLFAEDIPSEWIEKILDYCQKFDNRYLFQTKNPERFKDYLYNRVINEKSVFCTTIESNRWYKDIMKNSPSPFDRSPSVYDISCAIDTYVTIEPIMDFDLELMLDIILACNPTQVNIGADSGKNGLPEPSKEKLLQLIEGLQEFTTIAKKSNLSRLLK